MGEAKLKRVATEKRHEAARMAIIETLKTFEEDGLSSQEIIAVLSFVIGQCSLFMDQAKWKPEQVLELVHVNIVEGNQSTLSRVMDEKPAGQA